MSKIAPSLLYAQYDKSLSRGENKEEFHCKVEPYFMFQDVHRHYVDTFVEAGYLQAPQPTRV